MLIYLWGYTLTWIPRLGLLEGALELFKRSSGCGIHIRRGIHWGLTMSCSTGLAGRNIGLSSHEPRSPTCLLGNVGIGSSL
jgi:hypothetical protein